MRVLMMMHADLSKQAGDAIRAIETAKHLSLYGIEPVLLTPAKAIPRIPLPFRAYYVYQPSLRFLGKLVWNTYGLLAASRIMAHLRPEVVYADVVAGCIAPLWVAQLWKRPLVIEVNGLSSLDASRYRSAGAWHNGLARTIDSRLYTESTAIVSARGWADTLFTVDSRERRKVTIVPLAVNHSLFAPQDKLAARLRLGLPQDAHVAVFIGYVGPWQGLELLLEAAPAAVRADSKLRFLIVGDGPVLSYLRYHVTERGLGEAFHFTGEVAYNDVPAFIAASDVGLALFPPDRGRVGGVSAMKTLSCLACGRPWGITF